MKYPYGLAADLHFHPWTAFASTDERGVNTRLTGLLSELRRCARETCNAGGDTVILAGDIFHVRGSVSPTVLNLVRDELHHCVREYEVQFYILAGNHDLEGRHSERLGSAVTALEMPGVQIVNSSMLEKGFCFVPWHDSIEDLKEEISSYGVTHKGELDLILHAPIDGVIEGLPAHGLTGEWLAETGFKRVFAGHYHNHKHIYDGDSGTYGTSVYSIGALAHHTWSDVSTKAGFLLVFKDEVQWFKSHLPEFIDLDRLTDVEPDELPFIVDGNYVRVKTESASAKEVASLREELANMNAKGVLIQAVPAPPKRDDGVVATIVAGAASLEASIGEYVKSLGDTVVATHALKEALSVLTAADVVEV